MFLGIAAAKWTATRSLSLACRLVLRASDDPLRLGGHAVSLVLDRPGSVWEVSLQADAVPPPVTLHERRLDRLLTLHFVPALAADGALRLGGLRLANGSKEPPSLSLSHYGTAWKFPLKEVEVAPDATSIALSWADKDRPQPPVKADGFVGRLLPTDVVLTVSPDAVALTLTAELRIENRDGVTLARVEKLGSSSTSSLELLGLTVGLAAPGADDERATETAGGLVRHLVDRATGSLLEGLPAMKNGAARGLLAVTFGSRETGSAAPLPVLAGRIELEVESDPDKEEALGVALHTLRATFSANQRAPRAQAGGAATATIEAASAATPAPWTGQVELHGLARLENAIQWPAEWQLDDDGGNLVAVRALAAAAGEQFVAHVATFELSGQRIELADLGGRKGHRLDGLAHPLRMIVAAHHRLEHRRGEATSVLRWSSIEPFALTSLAELSHTQTGAVTKDVEAAFVAGHRVLPGTAAANQQALLVPAAVFKPGFGRRADVLAGAESPRVSRGAGGAPRHRWGSAGRHRWFHRRGRTGGARCAHAVAAGALPRPATRR